MSNSPKTSPAPPGPAAADSLSGDLLWAYVLPFGAYLGLTAVEAQGWHGLSYPVAYTLKLACVVGLLWWFRDAYPRFSSRGVGWGVVAGLVGIVVWLVGDRVQGAIPGLNSLVEGWLGQRVGFNPFPDETRTTGQWVFLGIRLLGLCLVVPLMEEIFWRGFLARFLIRDQFTLVPEGTFTPASFGLVVAGFVAVHPELLAATAWGILINLLWRRTANLWACIAMHAITNALLGAWILGRHEWRLW